MAQDVLIYISGTSAGIAGMTAPPGLALRAFCLPAVSHPQGD